MKLQPIDFSTKFGGVDGTRTRDPRRDRPSIELSIHAGSRPIQHSTASRYLGLRLSGRCARDSKKVNSQ